jgi:hypothetical protein
MATSTSARILGELKDAIDAKRNLYRSCYQVFLKSLESKHGCDSVATVLAQLDGHDNANPDRWDASGHAAAVNRAVDRLLTRRAQDPEKFGIDPDSEI